MVLFDTAQDVFECFWRPESTSVDTVVDAGCTGQAFDRPEFIALWARLCGWVVPIVNGKNQIGNDKSTGRALVIVCWHSYTHSPHSSRRNSCTLPQ